VLDVVLRATHVLAVVVYFGGGIMMHGPIRRALRLVPPGQASILASQVGRDFTLISWASLVAWGVTGYWMLFRYGWGQLSSPHTLFIRQTGFSTSRGFSLLLMLVSWYLLVISACIITFVLRPRLEAKLSAGLDSATTEKATTAMAVAARWIDRLAVANLALTALGFLAGAVLL